MGLLEKNEGFVSKEVSFADTSRSLQLHDDGSYVVSTSG